MSNQLQGLAALATRRRVTVAMFCVSLIVFGLVALGDLKTNLLPDLSYPTLTVRTELEGAAPMEVEALVSKPVEEVLGVVKNLTQIRSVSRTGQSDVLLKFAWGTDMDQAALEVREKLEVLQLPFEVQRPILLRFNPSTDPIMRLGFTAGSDDPRSLKVIRRFAEEDLKRKLEPVAGVAAVKVSGGLEEEIQVEIDQQKLGQLGIDVSTVVRRLQQENVNISGGRLEQGTQRFLVRTINQFEQVDEIGDLQIANLEGRNIYLRDLATIYEGHKELEALIRINGVQAVEVAIYKEGDGNTVEVASAIQSRIRAINEDLPADTEIVTLEDQSKFISAAIDNVVFAALIGGLLAILIIYGFLRDARATVIIGLTIPISVIASFFLMGQADLSLNIMSLGGIALAVGLLVDNAIVALENISRHRNAGKDALTAAVLGTQEVTPAIIASTLTTVAVFVPLVFVEGIAGQLFRDQALTVTFTLLMSLAIALTLIPMMASLAARSPAAFKDEEFKRRRGRTMVGRGAQTTRVFLFNTMLPAILYLIVQIGKGISWVMRWALTPFVWAVKILYEALAALYARVLPLALDAKAPVLLIAVGSLGGAWWLSQDLGAELIPELEQGTIRVELRLPPGSPLNQTDETIAVIQDEALNTPGVESVYAVSGQGNRIDANPGESGENTGDIWIRLQNGADESAVLAKLREFVSRMPDVEAKFGRPELFNFATPLEIFIAGFDIDQLRRVSNQVAENLRTSDRFADVKSSLEEGYPEVRIRFDQDRSARLGLTNREVADQLVSKLRGDIASRFTREDRKIDILVRVPQIDRQSIADVEQVLIESPGNRAVPLSSLAEIDVVQGASEIDRVDQERVAVITANLAYGDLNSAAQAAQSMLDNMSLPPRMRARLAGQNAEMEASFESLLFALGLAVFLVYLVMASQFESLIHPLVIMFTVPLAGVGAVVALNLTGATISILVFIGLIMLAGIVVNNAIVLISLINQLGEEGMERRQAILTAGKRRLRPIVMTTLTTTLGLLPMALGIGEGAEVRAPMAITVIGGLLVSTLLTLIVIPVVYELLDRKFRHQNTSHDKTARPSV